MKLKATFSVVYSAEVYQHFAEDNFKAEKEWLKDTVKGSWPGQVYSFKLITFKKCRKRLLPCEDVWIGKATAGKFKKVNGAPRGKFKKFLLTEQEK